MASRIVYWLSGIFALFICSAPVFCVPTYKVHYLGYLPDTYMSSAVDINNAGQVIGWSNNTNDARGVFLWTKDSGMVDITQFGQFAFPGGLNNNGQAIGTADDLYNLNTAVIRNLNGDFIELSKLPDAQDAWGAAINDFGQATGSSGGKAVFWDAYGNIVVLGGDPDTTAYGSDVNNNGQVAWYSEKYGEGRAVSLRAYRWDVNGDSIELASLDGTESSYAFGISISGQVAGSSGGHAVVWNHNGDILDLGIGQSLGISAAYDINSQGQIVGNLGDSAVVWNADGSAAADLGALINGQNRSWAYAISDTGWIAGSALIDGIGQCAIVWEPVPEPSSLLVLASCLLPVGVAVMRRRRSVG